MCRLQQRNHHRRLFLFTAPCRLCPCLPSFLDLVYLLRREYRVYLQQTHRRMTSHLERHRAPLKMWGTVEKLSTGHRLVGAPHARRVGERRFPFRTNCLPRLCHGLGSSGGLRTMTWRGRGRY